MFSVDLAVGVVILAQTGIGTLGNVSHLCHYVCSAFRRHRLRSSEQIISHLALSNTLVLLCGGIPQAMVAFQWKSYLDDTMCKLVFYWHRVAWGSCLTTTCLLGGFQALSINPTNFRWAKLKFKSPVHINSPCILSWVFHLMVNIIVPMRITGQKNSTNVSVKSNLGYCSRVSISVITEWIFAVIFVFIDVICLGLMIWVSGFMIYFLHRHKQQVQYLHSTSKSPSMSPEARATKSVLTVVSAYVIFYSFSYAFEMQVYLTDNPQLWLRNASVLLTAGFPILSPFLLFKSNSHVFSLCSS